VLAQQALEALGQMGDASLTQKPAFLASQIALLEAVGDVSSACAVVDGAIAAQQSRPASKSKQEREANAAAQAYLYQTLARLQLKVCACPLAPNGH
jgi:hypothetical protein